MQRFNSQLVSFTPATAAIAALVSLAAAAQAAPPAARVTGGGQAALIDEGTESPLQFQIAAMVFDDESAVGHAIFVLRKPFARDWGAVPGVVDLILLKAEIHAGSVAEDGTITLNGEFTEVDISFSEGVVFVEKDTELTSLFEIVLGGDRGPGEFTLQWCLLPAFEIEVTKGRLRVK